jgi:predicted esterase
VVASLPLFKAVVDRGEVGGGLLVGFRDEPVIAPAYRALLGRIFALVPNIDTARSAMVGFSNGALTLAVLLSSHDEFVLSHFRSFVLVDQGMFHLTDLHEAGARDARYLILVGDQPDQGRDLKLRGCALQQDSWRLLHVDLTCEIMKGTGHAFPPDVMARVGQWLNEAPAAKAASR